MYPVSKRNLRSFLNFLYDMLGYHFIMDTNLVLTIWKGQEVWKFLFIDLTFNLTC